MLRARARKYNHVRARSTYQRVVAVPADERVGAGTTLKLVITVAAFERIVLRIPRTECRSRPSREARPPGPRSSRSCGQSEDVTVEIDDIKIATLLSKHAGRLIEPESATTCAVRSTAVHEPPPNCKVNSFPEMKSAKK